MKDEYRDYLKNQLDLNDEEYEGESKNAPAEAVQILVSVVLIVVLVMGATALLHYLSGSTADKAEEALVTDAEELQEVTCRVVSVDATQHTESDRSAGTGVAVAGGKPVVVTGVVPAGEKTVTDYYVTLEDGNGTVIQFTVQGDVYTALGKKIGDEISLTYHPSKQGIVVMMQPYYDWQGKKLTNPIVIKGGE